MAVDGVSPTVCGRYAGPGPSDVLTRYPHSEGQNKKPSWRLATCLTTRMVLQPHVGGED